MVRDALGLDDLHLFGSSWGGMLAMQYVLDRTPPLRSLVLCGSPTSIPRWIRECAELLEAEPEAVRATIRDHEASGFTACPEYQGGQRLPRSGRAGLTTGPVGLASGSAGPAPGRAWRRSRRSAISRSSAKVIFRLPGSPGTTATSRSV